MIRDQRDSTIVILLFFGVLALFSSGPPKDGNASRPTAVVHENSASPHDSLIVYNLLGQQVAPSPHGLQHVRIESIEVRLPPSVYLVRSKSGTGYVTKKVVLGY
jgi:hypothetical protein